MIFQVFSNNPVELVKLDEAKNAVLIGKWDKDISDGGCHLWDASLNGHLPQGTVPALHRVP